MFRCLYIGRSNRNKHGALRMRECAFLLDCESVSGAIQRLYTYPSKGRKGEKDVNSNTSSNTATYQRKNYHHDSHVRSYIRNTHDV